MESQYEQLTIFLDSINEEARKVTENIMREADEFKVKELEKAQIEAAEKSRDYIRYESEKLKTQSNRKVSEANKALRKLLLEKRSKIADSLFTQVTENLKAFTVTEEYKTFLLSSAKQMADFYKDAPFVLLLKNDDLKHTELLTSSIKTLDKVSVDNTILIGGCKASCENNSIELDDTIDTRLENEKEWFYTNSKLAV